MTARASGKAAHALTTDQLAALAFSRLITARHRLSLLVELGVEDWNEKKCAAMSATAAGELRRWASERETAAYLPSWRFSTLD